MAKTKRPSSATDLQIGFGRRIQFARELVEPNRAAFARLMGIHPTTLLKIETGERAPSVFNVLQIADRLRLTTDFILTGSLRGLDGEIAALLVTKHPELLYEADPEPLRLQAPPLRLLPPPDQD